MNDKNIFNDSYYIHLISQFLEIKDIVNLSMANKNLKLLLNPNYDEFTNYLFFKRIYRLDNKRNIKANKTQINWLQYFKELVLGYKKYKSINIVKLIKYIFSTQIFHKDLRKEDFISEHQRTSLIILPSDEREYIYYSKYITPEFIFGPWEKLEKIKVYIKGKIDV